MATVRKIREVKASIMQCPAKIFAKRRMVRAIGLVRIPKNSITGIIGSGALRNKGTSGHRISFQYALFPKTFTAMKVQSAKTSVTAIFPVRLAPSGKIGISPRTLLKKIKKKAVSR
jgi:hypothetical protein